MAYNNGFPATYPQMYYQPQFQTVQPSYMQQTQQPTQQSSGIIWVQGEAAARSYLMAPNTTLPLWDSETNTIFLKTTDAAGMPSMKVLDYTIRENTHQAAGRRWSSVRLQPLPYGRGLCVLNLGLDLTLI